MTAGRLSGGRLLTGRYRTGAEFAQAVIGYAVGALCGIGHYHGIELCFFGAVLHNISHSLLSGIAGIRFLFFQSLGDMPITFLKAREKCSWLS